VLPLSSDGSRVRIAAGARALEFVEELRDGRFERSVDADSVEDALPEGVTLVVSTAPHDDARIGGATLAPMRAVGALVTRGRGEQSSALSVLLAVEETSRSEPTIEGVSDAPLSGAMAFAGRAGRRGVLLAEAPHIDGAPLVVVMPPVDEHSASLALIIAVSRAESSGRDAALHAQAVERCMRDVARERDEAARRARVLSPEEASVDGFVCAVQALEIAAHHRSALAFLARSSGAPLAEAVALGASEESLARFARTLIEHCGGTAAFVKVEPSFGWLLESEAYRILAQWTLADEITPDLSALLVRRAGETARHADELERAIAWSHDATSLEKYFIAENLESLEESRPASRVRAFDWLAARGLAPKGYDPLASESERRAALSRAEELDATRAADEASAKEPR
jgi:hypothetical protein